MGVSLAAVAASLLVLVAMLGPGSGRGAARRRLLDSGQRSAHGAREVLAALGRRLVGGAVDPGDEALVGAAALGLVGAVALFGALGGLVALAAAVVAVASRRRSRRLQRRLLIERGLPEVIDLLALVVGAGRPAALSFADVCGRLPEPYRAEFARTLRRTAAGEPFVDSVRQLRERIGPQVDAVVHAVASAEIDGVPLAPALVRASDEAHRRRRVRAEEAARRVPVMMLFPLVFCILPSFCLLTIVPVLMGSLAELQFPG